MLSYRWEREKGQGMATTGMAVGRVGRRIQRPSGAYKLLCMLLYGSYPWLRVESQDGLVGLTSVRKMARCLGTESSRVNKWLLWLENMGYIEALSYSQNRREVYMRISKPRNIR